MDREFDFGGRKFKLSKLDAFKQFHVVRRIAPILSELLPALKGISAPKKALGEEEQLEQIAKFAVPVMTGLSKLSDADAEFVLHNLLFAVEMQQPTVGNWVHVSNGTILMFQDLEFPTLIQLAGRAFMYNLSGFFAVLPQQ